MKYFSIILIIVLSILFNEVHFAQGIESRAENSVLNKIIKAYETGEIDYATMMKNRIYALTNPELLDTKFKTDRQIIEKCATTNVLEIKEYLDKQSKNDIPQDAINGILARPTKQKFLVSPSGRFRIQYDTSGTHAVYQPTVDVNPADGHPDYVNRCAEIFDYVYDIEITQMGYTPPPPDGTAGGGVDQYDVYLHSYSGAYGVTFTDGTVNNYGNPPRTAYKSYIYCDPTYTGFGYTDRTLPLKVTAAHEYFHAIQFAYNANAGSWFMEISSTWIEDIVYDNINDYRYYLPTFFNSPQVSLTKFDGAHEYASCIFGHYISENFGNDRIKRIWDYTVNAGSNIALNSIQNALNEIGTNRSDVFAGFTVWNYLTGSRANGTHPTYSEAAYFPQINIASTYSSYPVSANAPAGLEFLATFYYHFNPITTPSNLRLGFNQISSSSWKGKVVIDSSNRFKSYDVDLSTGSGIIDLLNFNNKTRAVFIPANVATSGTNLSYSYTANMRLLPTVNYPNGGEELYIDSLCTISWTSSGIDSIKIEYTTDNGGSWLMIAQSVPASVGSYNWFVPATPTTQARVKITSKSDINLADMSNNVFKIMYTPYISIISPDISEVYPVGFTKNIEWNSLNVTGNVKIELSRDDGNTYETIFASTDNDGNEPWLVTEPVTEQAKIKISSVNSPAIFDISRANFSIRTASISLIYPNGGEIIRYGTIDTIRWISNNMFGKVKILLSRDGGENYETIIDSTIDDGEELWNVTGPQTTNAQIKIVSLNNNQIFDISDNLFNIYPQNYISLEVPSLENCWLIDSSYNIYWQSFGTSCNVKIELSRDNGQTYETIIPNTPDDGEEIWTVSGPASHQTIIKISDVNFPDLFGLSDHFIIGNYDTLEFSSGWNLISLKGYTGNKAKTFLYPSATSNAFRYSFGYDAVDTLKYGEGYWLKFNEEGISRVVSAPRYQDTISVVAGWNLIGSISLPIPTSSIVTDPPNLLSSMIYGYNKGYKLLDTLEPGKSVWVKSNQNGIIVLSGISKATNSYIQPSLPMHANILKFVDDNGNTQNLFLMRNNNQYQIQESYKLPPLPPSTAFDIRFNNDELISYYDEQNNEFRIKLQGVYYPLKITFDFKERIDIILSVNGIEHNISEMKDFIILDQPNADLILKLNEHKENNIPKEYFLSQNYPNPFNPSTLIKYGLPEDGFVSLKVYNLLGNEIKALVNGYQKAGNYEVVFENDNNLPNGVYYYQLKTKNSTITKKALLIK